MIVVEMTKNSTGDDLNRACDCLVRAGQNFKKVSGEKASYIVADADGTSPSIPFPPSPEWGAYIQQAAATP